MANFEFLRDGKTPRCQETVPDRSTNWPHFYQCQRAAHKDGEGFCKQHSPKEVAKRNEAREVANNASWQRRRVELAGRRFLLALKQIAAGHNDPRRLAADTIKEHEEGL